MMEYKVAQQELIQVKLFLIFIVKQFNKDKNLKNAYKLVK